MKTRLPLIWGAILILLLMSTMVWIYSKPSLPLADEQEPELGLHYASYSQRESYTGLENPQPVKVADSQVYGGIVSHHFYVETEIAKFFQSMKNQKPKTVVIIGPNHFNAGNGDILISRFGYETPYGILQNDQKLSAKLIDGGLGRNEEKPFEMEHSISALVGFAEHTFPDTKFVPIMVKRGTSKQRLDELADFLNRELSSDSLVIASVDFSHHQNRIAADYHDRRSIAAIEGFQYDSISNLEIDSPPSIYTLLQFLEKRGAGKMAYEHVNQAEFSGNLASEDVTSYLFAHFSKGKVQPNKSVSVLSFGDVMFDRLVKNFVLKGGDPFEKIKGVEGNFFRGSDFIAANLEGPITDVPVCQQKEIVFKFPAQSVQILKENKFNLLNLANNHMIDCYKAGLEDSRESLTKANIAHYGDTSITDKSYTTKTVDGARIAFLGVNTFPLSAESRQQLPWTIKKLKSENDFVVVNIHWGVEYNTLPSTEQTELAHLMVDSGADLIIGHHPHVVQSMEIYKDKPIFYSLGNFLFDQNMPGTNSGLGVGAVFKDDKQYLYLFPYQIIKFQPTLLPYPKAKEFCDTFLRGIKTADVCAVEL